VPALGHCQRKTRFFSPWTNGQAERFNRTLKEATMQRFAYERWEQACEHVEQYLIACNMSRKLRGLGRKTPMEKALEWFRKDAKRFKVDPRHLRTGL